MRTQGSAWAGATQSVAPVAHGWRAAQLGMGLGWRLHFIGWYDARRWFVASVVFSYPGSIEGRGGRVAEELLEGIGHPGEAGLIP